MVLYTAAGVKKVVTFQHVPGVRPLIGGSRLTSLGYEIFLNGRGGYIFNPKTGEKIKLEWRRGVSILKLWRPPADPGSQSGFSRQ